MIDVADFYSRYLGIRKPHSFQEDLFETLLENQRFPVLLRAPCGSGKTEALAAPFLYQWVKKDFFLAPRLIYVLPMRALANQIFERLKNYAAAVNPLIKVSIQHGAKPKDPFFFADIVVTTLDQLIYGYARTGTVDPAGGGDKHVELPAGDLAHSIVAFDEAHMYSPYTFGLMHAFFEILNAAGIPFVLMTATMPESLQKGFSMALLGEPFQFHEVSVPAPECAKRSVSVSLVEERLLAEDERISDNAADLAERADRVLMIFNTVDRAVKAYRDIRRRWPGRDVVLLHSRFAHADREAHERKAISMLGRDGRGGIVVSTQVLEAGMDISASLLLTELAPADSLVQRAGRCNRWGEGAGNMIVFMPPAPDDTIEGSSIPYEVQHIEYTRKKLLEEPPDLGNWDEVRDFTNGLNYRPDIAGSAQASWTLIESAILLSAQSPQDLDLAVRDGTIIDVVLVDEQEIKKKKKDKDQLLEYLSGRPRVSTSFDMIYYWSKTGNIKEVELGRDMGIEWRKRLSPFGQIFVSQNDHYDSDTGFHLPLGGKDGRR